MKNKRLVISILAILTVLTAAIIAYSQAQQPSRQTTSGQPVITDAIKFASEYKSVAEDNRFTYISGAQATELLQNGSGILFLGFEECPWCQGLAPLADEAAKAEDLSKINYLDIRAAREANDSDYQKLVEILKEYLSKDDEGQPRIYVPDVTAVKDGKIVARFKQESAPEGTKADSFWTPERKERAISQLRDMIRMTR